MTTFSIGDRVRYQAYPEVGVARWNDSEGVVIHIGNVIQVHWASGPILNNFLFADLPIGRHFKHNLVHCNRSYDPSQQGDQDDDV